MDIYYIFENNKLIFTNNDNIPDIPYDHDVDLTAFINELSKLIDCEKEIHLIKKSSNELSNKEKIINNIIKQIEQEFNKIIQNKNNIETLGV